MYEITITNLIFSKSVFTTQFFPLDKIIFDEHRKNSSRISITWKSIDNSLENTLVIYQSKLNIAKRKSHFIITEIFKYDQYGEKSQ